MRYMFRYDFTWMLNIIMSKHNEYIQHERLVFAKLCTFNLGEFFASNFRYIFRVRTCPMYLLAGGLD